MPLRFFFVYIGSGILYNGGERVMCLEVLARGKINWSLDVLARRPDGYHTVDMILQSIALADRLTFRPANEIALEVIGDEDVPEDETNLAWRAAEALRQAARYDAGVHMVLEKHIPSAAGLGGGSADAAAVLWGCNQIWGLDWPLERLQEIGLRLGADIPFCLQGGLCRAGGVGEVLEAGIPPRHWLVLCTPKAKLSAGEVYGALSLQNAVHPDIAAVWQGLQTELGPQWGLLDNTLTAPAQGLVPVIASLRARLLAMGAWGAIMSGSGPTVFGIFAGQREANVAALATGGIVTYTIDSAF